MVSKAPSPMLWLHYPLGLVLRHEELEQFGMTHNAGSASKPPNRGALQRRACWRGRYRVSDLSAHMKSFAVGVVNKSRWSLVVVGKLPMVACRDLNVVRTVEIAKLLHGTACTKFEPISCCRWKRKNWLSGRVHWRCAFGRDGACFRLT